MDERALNVLKRKQKLTVKRLSSILISLITRHETELNRAVDIQTLSALSNLNIFNTANAKPLIDDFNKGLTNIFKSGIQFNGGKATALGKTQSETFSDIGSKFVSDLGERIKTDSLQLITDGIANPEMNFNDIKQSLVEYTKQKPYEAERVVRTETMRASNSAAYLDAYNNGATHFIVDNREEACELCQAEFEGEVFTIDQTDMIPPYHPNCACVAMFFNNAEDANMVANDISQQNNSKRNELEDNGYTVADNGTGATLNKEG